MATLAIYPPVSSMKLSPQDVLTQKKRQLVSKTYVQNTPRTNIRPASIATTLLAGRVLRVTPAGAGGTWNNRVLLGTEPCCSS